MSDPWVTRVQTWLNTTYASTPGVPDVEVTGRTGWSTMYALTRALQHELGLSSLSDTFGPGTLAALQTYGDIGPAAAGTTLTRKQLNINNIIRAGFYCKGYNGGNGELDGSYSPLTVSATQSLRVDIGIAAGNGKMTPKIFKALLTMDAYVLLDGGSTLIRQIQRDLNSRYISRRDFYAIPADGFFSRGVQSALLYAVQYELGLDDNTANGNFGPTTQNGIRTQGAVKQGTVDTTKYFVHLFQAALTFNSYPTPYGATFTANTKTVVQNFQAFSALPVTGEADFATWASLLTSTGDTTRPGTAVDCITTITPARAATLVANGYRTVGRYLTNTPVIDPLDKNIKPGELATIFSNGLTVFPIFQEGGTGTEYFNYEKGVAAARRAHLAAASFGFKTGTTIYFAVDFDALQDQVEDYVVPHFQGINDCLSMLGSGYRVGIYGARNTCSIVSDAGLAWLSFVSGMSTGFSGNLGFPLPSNWAFDQILEYTIGTGAGAIGIDKNIQSGRDAGQSGVDPISSDPNNEFFSFLDWLQALAHAYVAAPGGAITLLENDLVLQYLRYRSYGDAGGLNNIGWASVGGLLNWGFIDHINAQVTAQGKVVHTGWWLAPSVLAPSIWTDLDEPLFIDVAHMAAAANAVTYNRYGDAPEFITKGDFGGWAGDLITLLGDYKRLGKPGNPKTFAYARTGGLNLDGNTFPLDDLIQDADGANLGYALKKNEPVTTVAVLLRGVIAVGSANASIRFKRFYDSRFQGAVVIATAAAKTVTYLSTDLITGMKADTFALMTAALATRGASGADFTPGERDGIAAGFAEKLAYLSSLK
jgi:peptidoglycan hydrolase-like protein with peptidoglycan-binding domain